MSRTYRFLNVGNTGGYGDAYTQDGKQYFGFQPLSDGKIAFLRKGYRSVDDADRGQLSTIADVRTKDEASKLRFFGRNPQTEPDPLPYDTLNTLADSKDGIDSEGNLIRSRYHRPYRAVEYEGLRNFLDVGKNNRTESRTTPSPQGTPSPQSQINTQERQRMTETTPATPPTTGEQLIERLGEQATGTEQTVPEAGKITTTPQQIQQDELLTTPTGLQTVDMATSLASKDNLAVPSSTKTVANTYNANLVGNTPEAIAAQGKLSTESLIGDVQGAVSEQSQVTAQTEELDPKASVQYQLSQLYESLEEGKPLPAWAAPAVRAVSGIMQQRGLGASSMASAAITQAIFESGIPIAKADADRFATIQLQNLNNKQQATLQNAMTFAAMDKANLDARMTAAVNNAKSFLSIDMANLDNKQKTQSIDYQGKLQALLTDAAAQNASEQFNAKSQNQLDEFFAELDGQIQQSNANRLAATEQFNVDQANANARYVQGLNDQREQFNLNMQTQIDQSNAVWRRNINTANTAAQNETNRQNALNTLNVSQSALNALWQRYRDEASWLFTSSESAKQREHQLALTAMEVSAQTDMYEMKSENDMYGALGGATLAGIFGLLGR